MPANELRRTLWSVNRIAYAIAIALISSTAVAEDVTDDVFRTAVAPVLQTHCISCHGPEMQEGGLRLDSLDAINKGGKSGAVIEPGKSAESLLITAINRTDELLQMPPDEKLPADAIKSLTDWVQAGAIHPDGKVLGKAKFPPFDVEEARKFWAFQPVQSPAVLSVKHAELVASPIDAFVVAKLEAEGLSPNAIADKRTLVRRAAFDLTGLPLSSQDVDAFLADESPDAYAKLIDRLLESQQYGEHWGRHWLDVVRYADSNGLDENIAHGNAWRFRNYVIRSLNADKPYDQFIREQIAGDLLVDATTDESTRNDRLIATGFLSMGPKVLAEGDETKLQMDILDEQLDTLGRATMGLTIGCARCHNHKFDPIAQADYYAMAGIFQSTRTMESLKRIAKWNENSIATAADKLAVDDHQKKIDGKKAEIADRLLNFQTEAAASAGDVKPDQIKEEQLSEDAKKVLASLREELKQLESSIPELPTAMGVTEGEIKNARVLPRGNHLTPADEVGRGIPVVLASTAFEAPADRSGRLEFAHWLTSPSHPLTARVMVNRVWRWHFGRGLVATADNFGKLGERPSHPELLDWLASEFVRNGWSLKWLHRQILMSRTWQLDAGSNPDAERIDPDNILLWRWTMKRLPAESVRDSVLAVSGQLDRSEGTSMLHVKNREFLFDHTSKDGTSYDSKRRSVYLPVIRNNLYDAMSLFDCTDATVPNGDRASSTVASQALFLMNSDLVIQAAEHLAGELVAESPDDPANRIRSMFQRTISRPATDLEVESFLTVIDQLTSELAASNIPDPDRARLALAGVCQTLLMSNEFLYVR